MGLKLSDAAILFFALILAKRRLNSRGPGPGPGRKRTIPGGLPRVLSIAQLRELAQAVGMQDWETGAAVAMAESHGDSQAVGDKGDSIGLWQINVPSAPKAYKNATMLKDPGFNAQAALSMSNGGTDFSPWTTFRNGAYKKFLVQGK